MNRVAIRTDYHPILIISFVCVSGDCQRIGYSPDRTTLLPERIPTRFKTPCYPNGCPPDSRHLVTRTDLHPIQDTPSPDRITTRFAVILTLLLLTFVIRGDNIIAEEFYNTFYKAFTSESSETSTVAPKSISKAITENIKHDNFYGTHSKPPKLKSIEDYTWWKERFINWAKAYAHESWFCLEFRYDRPVNDKGEEIPLKSLTTDDKRNFSYEQRMIALIQSSIRDDIFALLEHDGSSKSVWEVLRVKAEGGKQIKKTKIALLKKEFDLFDSLKG
ncbi:hypothetical protein HanIR_Chr05g0236161 [Helianthus annuus]|nr:hypothetical protein HanIR_Chr05g0236161 [Helianthus annuus]